MAPTITQLMESQETYCIKPGYHHRDSVIPFDDKTVPPFAWQNEVYAIARALYDAEQAKEIEISGIVDIGCGQAVKALHFFGDTFHYPLLVEDPDGPNWWMPHTKTFGDVAEDIFDTLVICADVIEHVADPAGFLERILLCQPRIVVLSTPARHLEDSGPPGNTSHYREWSKDEFHDFVQARVVHMAGHLAVVKYVIESHFISSVPNGTQTMVLRKL